MGPILCSPKGSFKIAQYAVPLQVSRGKLLEDIPGISTTFRLGASLSIAGAPVQGEAGTPEELIIVVGLQEKLSLLRDGC